MVHGKTAGELYCLAIQARLRPGAKVWIVTRVTNKAGQQCLARDRRRGVVVAVYPYIFGRILWGMLRAAVMLIASAVAVCVIVSVMELLLQSWGSRIVIECSVIYFVILWIGEKIYRREK